MESRTETTLPLLLSLSSSTLGSIVLWPTMMVSSCLRREEQQDVAREGFQNVDFNSRAIKQLAEVLDLLWKDPDPRAYGPRGLDFVMKKHGWSICMT